VMQRLIMLLEQRLDRLEKLVRRITQIESKPRLIVGGSGGGLQLYRFTLNESWTSGVADADILEMDGTDTGLDRDVLDPLGIFDSLGIGDAGICVLQNSNYYVIQAPCPT
jgi:hypothetical protein